MVQKAEGIITSRLPHIYAMLNDVPTEDKPSTEAEFWREVASELALMIQYASHAEKPELVMTEHQKIGSQHIWEFWVNDLAIPKEERHNWHGQNTSQWRYAGAIVLQYGRVSSHH